jgi:hypothetical protein
MLIRLVTGQRGAKWGVAFNFIKVDRSFDLVKSSAVDRLAFMRRSGGRSLSPDSVTLSVFVTVITDRPTGFYAGSTRSPFCTQSVTSPNVSIRSLL